MMLSDNELYHQYLHGDVKAYDELMLRYADRVVSFLYAYLQDWQDAEDLMIDAFARIMIKKPVIREDGFRPYLFKTARNMASRFHEKKNRFQAFSLEDLNDEAADRFFTEEKILGQEKSELLKKCMDRLDSQQREALWMVYFEGLSYAEAADVMKVTKKRIDHLLSRGKENLRKELLKEGVTDAY